MCRKNWQNQNPFNMFKDRNFSGSLPSHQLAVDLFKGEWSSNFPETVNFHTGGFAGTFCDERISWAASKLGGFRDHDVLELGPLEGGHTYMMEKMGARQVTAIEGNPSAYLKCLIAKEVVGLTKATFLLGDFLAHLKEPATRYDSCIACGVLYHLLDPADAIQDLGKVCKRVFIWTHFYDVEQIQRSPSLANRFSGPTIRELGGNNYQYYKYSYGADKEHKAYCGGLAAGSVWMSLASLRLCLESAGFAIVDERLEQNPNGPAVWIAARKD